MSGPPDLDFAAGAERFICLDVETTGLMDNKLPADHPSQPHIAHYAAVMLTGSDIEADSLIDIYVKPDGWAMSMEAMEVNGLTTRFLNDFGRPISEVLDHFQQAVLSGRVVLAFNSAFDLKCLRSELRRAGRSDLFHETRNICLMRAYKAWREIFKGYKLSDACTYLGIPYERHHRAPADALAAAEVFRKLRALNVPIPAPAVYTSKEHDAIVARGVQ